jgi:hypothetical protein
MPIVNLGWRLNGMVNDVPSLLVHYVPDDPSKYVYVTATCRPSADPGDITAFEDMHWFKRLMPGVHPGQWGNRMERDLPAGPGRFCSDTPWLPAPNEFPGQTKWRTKDWRTGLESGTLTVTTAGHATITRGVESTVEPEISVESSHGPLGTLKCTLGKIVSVFRSTTIVHCLDQHADDCPDIQVLLPWEEGQLSLAEAVREYLRSQPPEIARAAAPTLDQRMRDAGLIADRPDRWEIYLAPREPSHNGEEPVTVIARADGPGRVLCAILVTDRTGVSIASDLMEFERT